MTPNTQGPTLERNAVMKAYRDKISAQAQEAKARLELLEATARKAKADAEIAAIKGLKAARQGIEARIKDLMTTHESNVSRAKAEMDADVAKFNAYIDELAARLKSGAAKK